MIFSGFGNNNYYNMELTQWLRSIIATWNTYSKSTLTALTLFLASSSSVMAQWNNLPQMWDFNTDDSTSLQDNLNRDRQRNGLSPKIKTADWIENHYNNDKIARQKNIACQNHLVKTWEECWDSNNTPSVDSIANVLYIDTNEKPCSAKEDCESKENNSQSWLDITRWTHVATKNISSNY